MCSSLKYNPFFTLLNMFWYEIGKILKKCTDHLVYETPHIFSLWVYWEKSITQINNSLICSSKCLSTSFVCVLSSNKYEHGSNDSFLTGILPNSAKILHLWWVLWFFENFDSLQADFTSNKICSQTFKNSSSVAQLNPFF